MIRLTILAVLTIFMTCNTAKKEQTETNEYSKVDSVLQHSKENAVILNETSKKSDTSIAGKVDKTIKKIAKMEKQIKKLKAENNELKEKLDDANDVGKPYYIRSVPNN